MTLREFAKGYDGNIMLKAFENEKSTAPAAIMMTQITDSIKDEVLDKEVYSYTMVCASLFERYLRVNLKLCRRSQTKRRKPHENLFF